MRSVRCYSILVLVLLNFISIAQPFEKFNDVEIVPGNFFEVNYIKVNNINSITIQFSEKRESQRIEQKDFYEVLYFSKSGYLERKKEYFSSMGTVRDSILNYYYRNASGVVTSHRRFHKGIIETDYFLYDKENRLIKRVNCNETLENVAGSLMKVQSQNILGVDSFRYEKYSEKQSKQYYYNREGREFKSRVLNYNPNKKYVSIYEAFKVTGVYEENAWQYDSNGFISEQKLNANGSGEYEIKWTNKYENALISLQNKYINGELLCEKFFFYEKGLLDSELNKDVKTKRIDIVKYIYTFY